MLQNSLPMLSFTLSGQSITQLDSAVTVYSGTVPVAVWNGTNSSGALVTNGAYYVTVENIDSVGNVTTISEKATVSRTYAQITVDVFNEAGEIVRHLYNPAALAPGGNLMDVQLSSDTIRPGVPASDPASSAQIIVQTTTAPVTLAWDGTGDSGGMVTDGMYVIGVHWDNGLGGVRDIHQDILVTGPPRQKAVVAEPNVLHPSQGVSETTFRTDISSGQSLRVSLYTLEGELLKRIDGAPGQGQVAWNAWGLASGIYLAVVEVRSANGGLVQRNTLKILVVR